MWENSRSLCGTIKRYEIYSLMHLRGQLNWFARFWIYFVSLLIKPLFSIRHNFEKRTSISDETSLN